MLSCLVIIVIATVLALVIGHIMSKDSKFTVKQSDTVYKISFYFIVIMFFIMFAMMKYYYDEIMSEKTKEFFDYENVGVFVLACVAYLYVYFMFLRSSSNDQNFYEEGMGILLTIFFALMVWIGACMYCIDTEEVETKPERR